MENHDSIVLWAIEHARVLKLSVSKLNWISGWIPGWFDLETSIEIDGRTYIGRGTAASFDLAMTKGLTEAVERFAGYVAGISSSNGVAGHSSPKMACENAAAELIERDSFLIHFYSDLPFGAVDSANMDLGEDFGAAFAQCRRANLEIRFFKCHATGPYQVRGCLIDGTHSELPFGAILGLGSSLDSTAALKKAFVEALRNSAWVQDQRPKPINLAEFAQRSAPEPLDHRMLALSPEFLRNLPEILTDIGEPWDHQSEPRLDFIELPVVMNLPRPPVSVFRAISPDLQKLFFGIPKRSDFNIERFQSLNLRPQPFRMAIPHPIG